MAPPPVILPHQIDPHLRKREVEWERCVHGGRWSGRGVCREVGGVGEVCAGRWSGGGVCMEVGGVCREVEWGRCVHGGRWCVQGGGVGEVCAWR